MMNELKMTELLTQMRAMAAAAQGNVAAAAGAAPAQGANATDFAALIGNAVRSVNDTQQHAEKLASAFELGDPKVNLADVMIATQKANLSFQAMTQVRNKLVQAYQDVMNMSV
jgi:flagellar hook-basal body complex protein FliE